MAPDDNFAISAQSKETKTGLNLTFHGLHVLLVPDYSIGPTGKLTLSVIYYTHSSLGIESCFCDTRPQAWMISLMCFAGHLRPSRELLEYYRKKIGEFDDEHDEMMQKLEQYRMTYEEQVRRDGEGLRGQNGTRGGGGGRLLQRSEQCQIAFEKQIRNVGV